MSYPTSELRRFAGDDTDRVALSLAHINLRYRMGMIAARAFALGFLIRGGIALGGLYHSSDIVFGEALIDAYRLESKVAVYPRILISPTVLRRPGFCYVDSRLFREDQDGHCCFEYIFPMLMGLNNEPVLVRFIARWYAENIGFVNEPITQL